MNKILLIITGVLYMINLQSQQISGLTLINADTNSDLKVLEQQDTIYLDITGSNLNIRADVSGTVGSVRFSYDSNMNFKTESVAPYAFAGDASGDYNPWTPVAGNHTITATPYSAAGAGGTAGTSYSVNLVVFESGGTLPDSLKLPVDIGNGEFSLSGELKKWHKISLSFNGPFHKESDTGPNPFLDYRLNVMFTNGETSYLVPGYFSTDGNAAETGASEGNIWRVHFSPDKEGEWAWTASFRFGRNIAVDDDTLSGVAVEPMEGKSGSFTVAPGDKNGVDLRSRGRLRYVGEHYLRFEENGEYFIKGGTDAPENLLAYEDFDNTPDNGGRLKSWAPHADDWNTGDPSWRGGKGTELIGAINYLAEEGLNAFSFLTMNINGDDKNVYPYVSSEDFRHFDCSKLDQWSILFDHATTKGMFLHFKTQETENETLLDGGNLGINRKVYYRELIARYGYLLALNWNLGEENSDQTDAQRKDMAGYFFENDPYHHPVVIHTYPNENAYNSIYTPLLGNNSHLTGASMQVSWSNVHNFTKTWVEKSADAGRKWVIANDEQGSAKIGVPDDSYTGTPSIHDIRKQVLWGNLMAGGAGVEYYFGYDLPHSDLNAEDFRSRDKSWDYVRFAINLFMDNQIPFWQMAPADNLVSSGWCLADQGNEYLVYLPDGGSHNLTLVGDYSYDIKWFDPRNGGELQNGSIMQLSGPGSVSLGTPPASPTEDWVIYIYKSAGIGMSPIAHAAADTLKGIAPLEITFDASASSDPDGSIESFEWTFGDGTTATGIIVSHLFTEQGDYLVELKITDNDGNSSVDVLNVMLSKTSSEVDCNVAPFLEKDNILVVEVESIKAGAGWSKESSAPGFSGDSYFRWNGGDAFNSPGRGLTEYKIYISNPGTYHFRWHSKIMHGTSTTESNDSWLRIPDADDFFAKNGTSVKYPKGGMFVQSAVTVEGASSGGWMKAYSSGSTNWTWSCRTSDSDAHEIYATFNEPGIYTVQISGRSNNHAVDRFVLFKDSKYSVSQATSLALEETMCQPYEYFTVTFTVNNQDVPLEGAEVTFNGTTKISGSNGEVIFNDVRRVLDASYVISADCHTPKSGKLDIIADIHENVLLMLLDEPPCNGEPLLEINNSLNKHIKVYPNPVNGILNISGLRDNSVIHLISPEGRILISEETSLKNFQVNTEFLSAGLYCIRILCDGNIFYNEKVIVDK